VFSNFFKNKKHLGIQYIFLGNLKMERGRKEEGVEKGRNCST
jgi:hypothetical protein